MPSIWAASPFRKFHVQEVTSYEAIHPEVGGAAMRGKQRIEERAGRRFAGYLDGVLLEIGRNTFTRRRLIRMGCPFFRAASILHQALARFKPRNVKELAARIDLHDLRGRKGVGERTVILWLYILDSVGVDSMGWLSVDLKISTLCGKKRTVRGAWR